MIVRYGVYTCPCGEVQNVSASWAQTLWSGPRGQGVHPQRQGGVPIQMTDCCGGGETRCVSAFVARAPGDDLGWQMGEAFACLCEVGYRLIAAITGTDSLLQLLDGLFAAELCKVRYRSIAAITGKLMNCCKSRRFVCLVPLGVGPVGWELKVFGPVGCNVGCVAERG